MSGIVIGAALALAPACDGGVSEQLTCEHVCECFYFFPSDQRACVDQCEQEIANYPQECIDCLANTECREFEGDACALECPIFDAVPVGLGPVASCSRPTISGGNDEVR